MKYFSPKRPCIVFAPPSVKTTALGGIALGLAVVSLLVKITLGRIFSGISNNFKGITYFLQRLIFRVNTVSVALLLISITLFVAAALLHLFLPDSRRIARMACRTLFCPTYGNPLHFKEGERLPAIRCKCVGLGRYELRITAISCTVEDLINVSGSISSGLNRRFERYAVTSTQADIAFNFVTFNIEDVTVDRSLIVRSLAELRQDSPTRLIVDRENSIDLTSSGSMLVAGKTRSGKTTGIIALLLAVLLQGPDECNSEVIIIDPKRAELSRLPHVVTVTPEGDAQAVIAALKRFAAAIVKRQQILNDLSEQTGDAVKWWDAGLKPSLCFIDEYVSVRAMLPKKAPKDNEDYSLEAFDGLLKRIITMGASAGCYAIISIAEASVQEGGLPAMLRSAMSTKILFKPTPSEAALMWDADKIKAMQVHRVYSAGDAWFSSTDGAHDAVSYTHFPVMEFPAYKELGRLLTEYYGSKEDTAPPTRSIGGAVPENNTTPDIPL